LGDSISANGDAAIYIDLRTIGSNGSIYSDAQRSLPERATRLLTDVLEAIHFKSVVHGRLELTAPWGFRVDLGHSGFYVVTRGTCWLEVDGVDEPVQLTSGDFVLLPHRQPHVLRDNRRTKAAPASEVFAKCPKSTQGCQPGGIRRYGGVMRVYGLAGSLRRGCTELPVFGPTDPCHIRGVGLPIPPGNPVPRAHDPPLDDRVRISLVVHGAFPQKSLPTGPALLAPPGRR